MTFLEQICRRGTSLMIQRGQLPFKSLYLKFEFSPEFHYIWPRDSSMTHAILTTFSVLRYTHETDYYILISFISPQWGLNAHITICTLSTWLLKHLSKMCSWKCMQPAANLFLHQMELFLKHIMDTWDQEMYVLYQLARGSMHRHNWSF